MLWIMVDEALRDKLQGVLNRTNEFLGYSVDHVTGIRDDVMHGLREIHDELKDVRKEVGEVMAANDAVTKAYRDARNQLASGGPDVDDEARERLYGEAERFMRLRSSFDERERYLRRRRDDLERERVRMERIMEHSSNVTSKMRLAVDILMNRSDHPGAAKAVADGQSLAVALQFAERESKRLAREIHDGPIQQFAATVLSFEYLERVVAAGDKDATLEEIKRIKAQIRETLGDFRGFLLQLQPVGLEKGLGRAIKRLAESYRERHGIDFSAEIDESQEEDDFPSVLRSNVFRIVQEAASNAMRHGKAKKIAVKYEHSKGELSLDIRDDGSGFNLEEGKSLAAERGSYGLSNMYERINFVNGVLDIESHVGQGTRITIKAPIGRDADEQNQDRSGG
ncbi:MAG: sensor histidine kinase [Synergistaceae bacterium]|nr:sensor histidine kinase [Synergistaceae bacterium]